ncbi:hypothetical protein [Actinomadura sp. 6N118]|uniref:hypothetical protein n=1 Tax=Actinomadura sp. 6N118 TaxID=3375151 RepID=UPI00379BB6DC
MAATAQTKTTRRRSVQKAEPEAGRRQARTERSEDEGRGTATVPVPMITPHVTVHRVHVPRPPLTGHEVVDAGKSVTSFLPPPDRLAYFVGLGAMAVAGLVEWPVAAAIGVGVAVAKRGGRSGEQRPAPEREKSQGQKGK